MTPRTHRVKAFAQVEIVVEFEDELLDYGSVVQAVQDAIGHTGAVVVDVDEYEEIALTTSHGDQAVAPRTALDSGESSGGVSG